MELSVLPEVASSVVEVRPDFSVNVIPESMFNYLSRSGLGGDYLLSDTVLDKKLSTEEIALLIFLNERAFEEIGRKPFCIGYGKIAAEIRSRKIGDQHLLNTKIDAALNLSYGSGVKSSLTSVLNGVYSETSPSYGFTEMGPKIWLIVKEGFLATLEDPRGRLNFYRDYINTVAKVAPFSSVSKTDVFACYVKELLS